MDFEDRHSFPKPPRPPNLSDPYLKASWAKEHLELLRKELESFYESKPYSFIRQDDVENGVHIIRVDTADPADRLNLIMGDVLYCLRAALDQLVWALAKLTLDYPRNTQFPILDKDIALSRKARERFETFTKGVPANAVVIIESLQPYRGGNTAAIRSHLLWQLNCLCNIDKHRRIPLHGTFSSVPTHLRPMISFQDDQIVAPLSMKKYMDLDPNISFKVEFGDSAEGISCDFGGIERIHNFVSEDVIPRFARFFQ